MQFANVRNQRLRMMFHFPNASGIIRVGFEFWFANRMYDVSFAERVLFRIKTQPKIAKLTQIFREKFGTHRRITQSTRVALELRMTLFNVDMYDTRCWNSAQSCQFWHNNPVNVLSQFSACPSHILLVCYGNFYIDPLNFFEIYIVTVVWPFRVNFF